MNIFENFLSKMNVINEGNVVNLMLIYFYLYWYICINRNGEKPFT